MNFCHVLKFLNLIIRTSLVYGFSPLDPRTRTLFQGLESGEFSYPYFTDEYRCPILVDDLSEALLELALTDSPPVLHIAGPERISRYDWAAKMASTFGFKAEKIPTGSLKQSGLMRPKDVSLSTSLAKITLKTKIRSIAEVLENRDTSYF